jgi:hypothetical protein
MLQQANLENDASRRTNGDGKGSLFEKEVLSGWSERQRARERNETNITFGDTAEPAKTPENFGIVSYSPQIRTIPREVVLQEWEGRVEEIQGRLLIARLVDITAKETEETEQVELPLDDITEADQDLIQPGTIFRWILGYRYLYGRKEKFARIVVRRLPIWTDREMGEADKEAYELHNTIFGTSEVRSASGG